MAVVVVACCSD